MALFRREFDVDTVPDRWRIAVSADNRYVLWLNGERLGRGPLRGTLEAYQVENYDLAERLRPGRNVLAAEVRWMGADTPSAEIHSAWPGWWVADLDHARLDTPGDWRVFADASIRPNAAPEFSNVRTFLGRLEHVDPARRPATWRDAGTDPAGWAPAVAAGPATDSPGWGLAPLRRLTLHRLPQLTEERQSFAAVWQQRRGVALPWTVPAGATGELWLDAGAMTTSYPELSFTGGEGRDVHVVYAEALGQWREVAGRRVWVKHGPRADLATGEPHGARDELVLPGGDWTYEPFHWRTFRFIKLAVGPGSAPVTVTAATHRFTTFPHRFTARFASDHAETAAWWDISLRTLRLCAHETYEDCPYYEQLNYAFDTRLQALCTVHLSNDTRLAERCIELFRDSVGPLGLPGGRAPSHPRQEIPPFALHWILMVHDLWRWRGEAVRPLVRSCLPGIESVLRYFRDRLTPTGFVGPVDDWAWIDWVPQWKNGISPAATDPAGCTFLTGLYAWTLNLAAELHAAVGLSAEAGRWRTLARRLRHNLRRHAWCEKAGLFLDAPGRPDLPFSQHAQVMAVLSGAALARHRKRLAPRLADDPSLVPLSLSGRFFLARALEAVDRYDALLTTVMEPWRVMVAHGLTTWQEQEDPSRSDCHGWSSWIVHEFLSTFLGVRAAAPGWRRIAVRPQYRLTTGARGQVPTPVGDIRVDWQREAHGAVALEVDLPAGVPATVLLPDGREIELRSGGRHVFRQPGRQPEPEAALPCP